MAKILVVDDNADNRNILARLVGYGGHHPVTATNGREAIGLARDTQPDLILMDLAMPEMDGWSATRRLKSDRDLTSIPVIVVTGHVTSKDISLAQEMGCNDVVSKPIDYHVLMAKISQHLTDQDPAPQAGPLQHGSTGPSGLHLNKPDLNKPDRCPPPRGPATHCV